MSEPLNNFAEFDALLESLSVGTLDETGHARLEALASNDLAARRRYLEKSFLIGALHARLAAKPSMPFAPTPHRPISSSPPRRFARLSLRPVTWSILSAGLLFAAYFVGISWDLLGKKAGDWRLEAEGGKQVDQNTTADGLQPTASAVATIRETDNVRWSSRREAGLPPTVRKGERLQIDSGLVELELKQGTKLVIEGPAEWTIDGDNSATLKRGKLVARVPTRAIRFAIETPMAKIVDLGTEFGVRVAKDGRVEAYVFAGVVEIESNAQHSLLVDGVPAQGRRSLRVGQSAMVHSSPIQAGSADAIGPADFAHIKDRFAATSFEGPNRRIAYVVPRGTIGNHDHISPQGMDFEVIEPIQIHQLGIFDSDSDGIASHGQLVVELWSRDDGGTADIAEDDRGREVLASASFSKFSPGKLVGGSRFKAVTQTTRLSPGSYTIIAVGFNAADTIGNRRFDPSKHWTLDDGDGAIRFSRWSRWCYENDLVRFPLRLEEHESRCQYAAGTFEFSVVFQPKGGEHNQSQGN